MMGEQPLERDDRGSRPWTVSLSAASVARSGGKAGHLATLQSTGFRVPDGFVVETAAFESFVREARLEEGASHEVALAASVPGGVATAIVSAYRALGGGEVAVRSSGVAEDLDGAAFAGQYETILGVSGEDAVVDAVRRCWASVFAARVTAYRSAMSVSAGAMAVLVQRMVKPRAAGVAFTADPVTGRRDVIVVSAVRGLGEALVSGDSSADEWQVEGGVATRKRTLHEVLTNAEAIEIAGLASRIAAHFGAPQDVEWAIDDAGVAVLQARPMTALPEPVVWQSPLTGAWVRNFRLGEWIGDPVTPLFDSWLLERLEGGLVARLLRHFPMKNLPPSVHVTVHGWYFYGLYMPESLGDNLSMMLRMLPGLWRDWRYLAGFLPPTAHLGFDRHLEVWRDEVLPAYQRAVETAERRLDGDLPPAEIPALIDELADHASAALFSILALGGTSAKVEGKLMEMWRKHVAADDSALVLGLVRSETPPETPRHMVSGLDWFFETTGERADRGEVVHVAVPAQARERIATERARIRAKADAALTDRPKIARELDQVLAFAQRAHAMREEQSRAFTLAWPAMRRAVAKLGESLQRRGTLAAEADVYFITRTELDAALAGSSASLVRTAHERRATWERQRRLSPPLLLGELTGIWKKTFAMIEDIIGAKPPDGALRGMPGSPGRVTAKVRVVRSLSELARLREGEILVTPVTTPAWTPAFAVASAVVTDTGSIASHASIVAREYGIPAVVAAEGATATLVDGQTVTVDGTGGFVVI